MKNNEEISNEVFKMAWAVMPLSSQEMEKIPYSHRKRPYLLCMEKEKYYYAFPATSHIENNKIRYQNEKIIVDGVFNSEKSLIKLEAVYRLPKDNIIGEMQILSGEYTNEIIKKIKACSIYNPYPNDFKAYFNNKNFYYTIDDLVEGVDNLYVIIGYKSKNEFYVLPVYPYIINNTVLSETDGLKYYVDVDNIMLLNCKDILSYRTKLPGFTYGVNKKKKKDLRDLISVYKRLRKVYNMTDYYDFRNLQPGMVIDYKVKYLTNRLIVLEKYISDMEVIIGKENMFYKDYALLNIPTDIDLDYEIVATLSDDRLDDLIGKSIEKLNEKHLKKR